MQICLFKTNRALEAVLQLKGPNPYGYFSTYAMAHTLKVKPAELNFEFNFFRVEFNVITDIMDDSSYWMYFSAIYVQSTEADF